MLKNLVDVGHLGKPLPNLDSLNHWATKTSGTFHSSAKEWHCDRDPRGDMVEARPRGYNLLLAEYRSLFPEGREQSLFIFLMQS